MSIPRSWTIDPYLKEIDLEPEDLYSSIPLKKVPFGDVFEAARAGDVDRLGYLLESGVNVNARDQWDSVALYYACLAGHLNAVWMLLQSGAICSEQTFDGDRCHYAALNLKVRDLLKAFEARPPPLSPLQSALRDTFLSCPANRSHLRQLETQSALPDDSLNGKPISTYFPPDFVFYVQDIPIEVHRVILSARSPFFKKKFENEWKDRQKVRFSKEKLYNALYSLIDFFYSDKLEILVSDMEDLVRICKVCKCESLRKIIYNELIHQKYVEYKAFKDIDSSQKRYIVDGRSLPEEDRLPSALNQILQVSLANSSPQVCDLADVCVSVDDKMFRCHQVVLASRSDYFKTRLSRMEDFREGSGTSGNDSLPCIEENGLSADAFEKILEYMYTDGLKEIDPEQAEEIFDAASRYLLFPLKRVAADVLLPHLEMISPAETCHWLILSEMYGIVKIREYCLNAIACNFETFAEAPEFRAMLLTLPPPSGDSSLRTTAPSAPGSDINNDQGNLLDDLREKWLEIEAAELDKRDQSALLFDKRLEMLVVVAEQEKLSDEVSELTILM